MSKLMPITNKQMKSMGIVKNKNGFLMRPVSPKSDNHKPKEIVKSSTKPERYVEDKAPKKHVEPVKQSTVVNSSVNRVDRKQESQRMADRGIYK